MARIIEPYTAVALQTTLLNVRKREDVKKNLRNITDAIDGIHYLRADTPVRLLTLGEAAIQTFVDTQLRHMAGYDMKRAMSELGFDTTVPGPETEVLAEKAKKYNMYIMGQLRAVEPEIDNRYYFNIGFIIDPKGEVILKYHKIQTFVMEPSVTPIDLYDKLVALKGNTLDTFFPVVDTDIGKIGIMICNDIHYPEVARGLAMNGAEIICCCGDVINHMSRDWTPTILRARAVDNNTYVIFTNSGSWYLTPESTDPAEVHGGQSMIIDYTGNIMSRFPGQGTGYAISVIDIQALRWWRENVFTGSWIKDLRTEIYKLIYEKPIFPKNRYAQKIPNDEERKATLQENVKLMIERGIYTRSIYSTNKNVK